MGWLGFFFFLKHWQSQLSASLIGTPCVPSWMQHEIPRPQLPSLYHPCKDPQSLCVWLQGAKPSLQLLRYLSKQAGGQGPLETAESHSKRERRSTLGPEAWKNYKTVNIWTAPEFAKCVLYNILFDSHNLWDVALITSPPTHTHMNCPVKGKETDVLRKGIGFTLPVTCPKARCSVLTTGLKPFPPSKDPSLN